MPKQHINSHRRLITKYCSRDWWSKAYLVDLDALVTHQDIFEDMVRLTLEDYPELRQEWLAAIAWKSELIPVVNAIADDVAMMDELEERITEIRREQNH